MGKGRAFWGGDWARRGFWVRPFSLDGRWLEVVPAGRPGWWRRSPRLLCGSSSGVVVREAPDLEALGRLEEGVELLLGHVHLAIVHELQ